MVKMRENLRKEIELPEKVILQIDSTIKISGPQGEVEKKLTYPGIKIFSENRKIVIEAKKATRNEKKIFNSFYAHLRNMVRGVTEKYLYRMKICSGHFPMNLSVQNNQLILKNFFGESVPRRLHLKPNVEVKVEGSEILVSSASKEAAGQVAADIEQLCKIKNRDLRIFMDGCWITHKAGKKL